MRTIENEYRRTAGFRGRVLILALHSQKVPLSPRLRARGALSNTLGACCSSLQRRDFREKTRKHSPTCNVVPKWRLSNRVQLSNLELRNHDITCPISVQLEMMWEMEEACVESDVTGRRERRGVGTSHLVPTTSQCFTCLYHIYFS